MSNCTIIKLDCLQKRGFFAIFFVLHYFQHLSISVIFHEQTHKAIKSKSNKLFLWKFKNLFFQRLFEHLKTKSMKKNTFRLRSKQEVRKIQKHNWSLTSIAIALVVTQSKEASTFISKGNFRDVWIAMIELMRKCKKMVSKWARKSGAGQKVSRVEIGEGEWKLKTIPAQGVVSHCSAILHSKDIKI